MKGALRHPLVAGLLESIRAMGMAAMGLHGIDPFDGKRNTLSSLRATDLRIDSLKPRAVCPVPRSNGSARVRRAAVKARNVARNRRAHR